MLELIVAGTGLSIVLALLGVQIVLRSIVRAIDHQTRMRSLERKRDRLGDRDVAEPPEWSRD